MHRGTSAPLRLPATAEPHTVPPRLTGECMTHSASSPELRRHLIARPVPPAAGCALNAAARLTQGQEPPAALLLRPPAAAQVHRQYDRQPGRTGAKSAGEPSATPSAGGQPQRSIRSWRRSSKGAATRPCRRQRQSPTRHAKPLAASSNCRRVSATSHLWRYPTTAATAASLPAAAASDYGRAAFPTRLCQRRDLAPFGAPIATWAPCWVHAHAPCEAAIAAFRHGSAGPPHPDLYP